MTQSFRIGQVVHLLTKAELVDNVLYVLAISVEVLDEVHLEALGVDLGLEFLHREARGVAEGIAGDLEQDWLLVGNVGCVKLRFALQDGIFGGLQQDVQTVKDRHRHDDLLVFTFLKGEDQHIVRDVPDEGE